jgi:hypothetical protein
MYRAKRSQIQTTATVEKSKSSILPELLRFPEIYNKNRVESDNLIEF